MTDDYSQMRFTHNDHWIKPHDGLWRVGVTDFAQDHLGDVIHVELPESDDHHYDVNEDFGLLESLTSSMELHAPVAGIITDVNVELLSNSDLINLSPYERGWIVEMQIDNPAQVDELMDIDEYEASLPDDDDEE